MGTDQHESFVIVGGGLAGAEAAKTLRSQGYDGRLVIVAEEPHLPYERPPLTKEYLRGEAGVDKLLVKPISFYEESRIEVLSGRRAIALDPVAHTLTLDDDFVVPFDRLLLATGARATRPPLPGIDEPWVHVLRTVADADRLQEAARAAGSVVVAGGGWIAAEAAASLRQLGLDVTLVVPGAEVLERHLGPVAGRAFTELHERHGVRVVRSARVEAFVDTAGRRGVRLDNGDLSTGDLAVAGFGSSPAVELAVEAGLGIDGGIVADERLMTLPTASSWRATSRPPGTRDTGSACARSTGTTPAGRDARRRGTCSADRSPTIASRTSTPTSSSSAWSCSGALLPASASVRRERRGMEVAWVRDAHVVAAMHANVWDGQEGAGTARCVGVTDRRQAVQRPRPFRSMRRWQCQPDEATSRDFHGRGEKAGNRSAPIIPVAGTAAASTRRAVLAHLGPPGRC